MPKILYFLSHPVTYQSAMIRKLEANDNFEFQTVYLSDYGINHHFDEGYNKNIDVSEVELIHKKYKYLKSVFWKKKRNFFNPLTFGILRQIIKYRPDVVWIHGYAFYSILVVILYSKMVGAQIILRGDSNANNSQSSLIRRLLFYIFRALKMDFFYIGESNKQFYKMHKVEDEKLFFMPFAVDNDTFAGADARRNNQNGKINLLYAGKYQNRKNVKAIIEALSALPVGIISSYHLTIVGDGRQEKALKKLVNTLNLESSVTFKPTMNQNNLIQEYELNQVGILPSITEPWGLIINEYMAAGIVPIVSEQSGCASTLIEHGKTGYKFDAHDVQSLSDIIASLEHDTIINMSGAAKSAIQKYDLKNCVEYLESYLLCKKK